MDAKIPLLTDSGGYQVFSLSKLCKVADDGVEFRSHLDGSAHFFTPEKVLDIQRVIGSDIMMPLDQCVEYPIDEKGAAAAVKKTLDWAEKSQRWWKERFDPEAQALFGIVQGSVYPDLRAECAEALAELDLPGYSIGGLSVGEPVELYREITESTVRHMPAHKPRYMMGVGSPMEILWAVKCGVDMFDCVMPTRIARNGTLYTSQGRVNIKAAAYENDQSPLDPECGCPVCRRFTRAYLRHIFKAGEISALVYNTLHNLYFMKKFMDDIRSSIDGGCFNETYAKWAAMYPGKD
jgi:queuine tRNA-ribosyltransferase